MCIFRFKKFLKENQYKTVGNQLTVSFIQYDDFHRDNNLPAIIGKDGSCAWFIDGRYIRTEHLKGNAYD